MNGGGLPEASTAVVLVRDQRARRSAVRCIERGGHRAVRARSVSEALARSLADDVVAVVVDADHRCGEECVDLVSALARVRPDVLVLVCHPETDLGAMWRAFRCGAVPWVVPPVGHEQLDLPAFGVGRSSDARLAIEALREELGGRHAAAGPLLAQIGAGDADAAVEALLETGARALVHLRSRVRYVTPIEVLFAHPPVDVLAPDTEALTLWWTMIEAMAFRASGLRLALPEPNGSERDLLFGAFHAAATVLRFTARRRWRRPIDVLHEFTDGDCATPPREPAPARPDVSG